MSDQTTQLLDRIFSEDSQIYRKRGFMRRMGFGKRPSLLLVDLANGWTRANGPFLCDRMETIIPAVATLLDKARSIPLPIVYTTTAYLVTEGPFTDMGVGHLKKPLEKLKVGSWEVEIDDRLAPLSSEQVITKKRNSAFFGTYLGAFLRSCEVDTLIVCGVTMAGCIRHTVEDSLSEGLRTIVVPECIGDRVPGAIEWNQFDIEAKFGDVVPLGEVLEYLSTVQRWR